MQENLEKKGSLTDRRIDPQYARFLFPMIMGIGMSFVMSLVRTTIQLGFVPQLLPAWIRAFAIGTSVGVPTAVLVSPLVQRLAQAARRPQYMHLIRPTIMAVLMSFTMSFVITAVRLGFVPNLLAAWPKAFGSGVIIAIPTAILVAPHAQHLVGYLISTPKR